MAEARRTACPQGTFVQLNTVETSGSIFHINGGRVLYTQLDAPPVSFDSTTEIIGDTRIGETRFYSDIGSSNIYAYALDRDAEVVVAPGS